jgi:hypothetical protein
VTLGALLEAWMPEMNWQLLAAIGVGLMFGWVIFSRSPKEQDKLRPGKPIDQHVLSYLSTISITLAITFWSLFYFSNFRPDLMAYPQSLPWWFISMLLGIIHSIGLPLLFVITMPNNSITDALQDSKKHTPGFYIQIAAITLLSLVSLVVLTRWMNTPGSTVAKGGYANWISIVFVIGTVVFPNLAWQQSIPANWQWQLQQAHEIKKMQRMHAAELMMMSAEHVKQIGNIMVDMNQVTVDQLPQIAEEYARFMKSMYGRMNGEMKQIGNMVGAVAGARDIRVPQIGTEEMNQKFGELQAMMHRGLELNVQEQENRRQLTDDAPKL